MVCPNLISARRKTIAEFELPGKMGHSLETELESHDLYQRLLSEHFPTGGQPLFIKPTLRAAAKELPCVTLQLSPRHVQLLG